MSGSAADTVVLLLLVVGLALLLGLGAWAVATWRSVVGLRELVREARQQVDEELRRRHELVPDLVETVRRSAPGETEALDAVVASRAAAVTSAAAGAPPAERAAREDELSRVLDRLLDRAQAYPRLVVADGFVALRQEVADTHDRAAAGARFHAAAVRALDDRVGSFPSSLVVRIVDGAGAAVGAGAVRGSGARG